MNRIIKFRAWEPSKNAFNYKVLAGNLDEKDENYTAGIIWTGRGWVNYDENSKLIIEQFTGLLDKNGKEIFEGDMVVQKFEKHMVLGFDGECSDIFGFHRGTVKILPSKGVVISPCHTEFDKEETSGDCYQEPRIQWGVKIVSYRCEIIGNIHEPPAPKNCI